MLSSTQSALIIRNCVHSVIDNDHNEKFIYNHSLILNLCLQQSLSYIHKDWELEMILLKWECNCETATSIPDTLIPVLIQFPFWATFLFPFARECHGLLAFTVCPSWTHGKGQTPLVLLVVDLLYNNLCNKIHNYNLQPIESRTTNLQQIHDILTCRDVVQ